MIPMAQHGNTIAEVLSALGKTCLPPPVIDPIQWLEAHRWLSPESAREVGPFKFSRAWYLEEPQRAILNPDIAEVVLDWASQCGKSELWINALLFWSNFAPGPALLVGPDWKSVRSLSSDRIRPAFRDARFYADEPELQRGGPGADNSTFRMLLNGKMPLTVVHASSASALAQRPVRYLVFDEVSRMPIEARGRAKVSEGDPLMLGKIRQTTFENGKTIFVSSPVQEGECRITQLFEDSTREKCHSRCQGCGNLQVLRLPEMNFDDATCRCLQCGGSFPQDDWQGQKGAWIAENPESPRRGFWLNAFVSPFVRWETIFAEFREATHRKEEGDSTLFRTVVGCRLAENFTEHVEQMSDLDTLLARREQYRFQVPNAAKRIVAAVDTQASWLEFLVVAVGARGEMWCLETGTVEGNIEIDGETMYAELDKRVLNKRWTRPDGGQMTVARCFQDSGGHATSVVYRYCKSRAKLTAYRGSHDMVGLFKRGWDTTTHTRLIHGNASQLKEMLANKLAIAEPGPGYLHFGNEDHGFDEEFFLQVLSERKEKRKRLRVIATRWVQHRDRNEALDLLTMTICNVEELYRGTLDGLEPQVIRPDKADKPPVPVKFGAQPIKMADVSNWQGYTWRPPSGPFGASGGVW